jgi:hypothetical protein
MRVPFRGSARTFRVTGALALAAVAVASAVSACANRNSGFADGDDSGATSGSSGSPSSSSGVSSSGTGSSSGKPSSSGSSSGRSSSGGSSSSSGGGGQTDTGVASSGGTAFDGGCDPAGGQVPTNVKFDSSGNPVCVGNTGCNLTTNVCCIDTGPLIPIESCIANTQPCKNPSTSARFGCVQKSDCPGNEVCCLQADQTAMTAGSLCLDVSDAGGKCTPATTSTRGSAQLCQTDKECKSGCCIWQDCTVMGNALQLTMCGIQNSSVFTCTAH